jgi:hypothetical protein
MGVKSMRILRVLRMATLLAAASFLVVGCSSAQLREERSIWEMSKPRLVGFPADKFLTCAGAPYATFKRGDIVTMRYGYIKTFSMAHVKCVLDINVLNGVIASYEVDAENPGGLTNGEQACAYVVDPCFGDGSLAARNTEAPLTRISSSNQIAAANQHAADAQMQLTQQMIGTAQTIQARNDAAESAATTGPQDAEIQQLRARLAEKDRLLQAHATVPSNAATAPASSPAAPAVSLPPQQAPAAIAPAPVQTRPAPSPKRTAPSLASSFVHGQRYEATDGGGLRYVAYVQNDGQVPLECDVRVSGIVWNSVGGPTNLQSNYNDRRRIWVYPGREGTAGFAGVVANSGRYEVDCKRSD